MEEYCTNDIKNNVIIRPATYNDIDGIVYLLNQLSPYDGKIQIGRNNFPTHDIIVATHNNVIVGTGQLFCLQKLSYGGSYVGQIEDVVIDSKYRTFGLGKEIINFLCHIAKERYCYKVILNCKTELVSFYERCGFKLVNHQMRKDL